MQKQVLPRFGDAPVRAITNSGVRQWVIDLMTGDLSAATTRKAVFALRQWLAAAIAGNRLLFRPSVCNHGFSPDGHSARAHRLHARNNRRSRILT
jgi:hypothetical protein